MGLDLGWKQVFPRGRAQIKEAARDRRSQSASLSSRARLSSRWSAASRRRRPLVSRTHTAGIVSSAWITAAMDPPESTAPFLLAGRLEDPAPRRMGDGLSWRRNLVVLSFRSRPRKRGRGRRGIGNCGSTGVSTSVLRGCVRSVEADAPAEPPPERRSAAERAAAACIFDPLDRGAGIFQ
jgi:hypothetical protein